MKSSVESSDKLYYTIGEIAERFDVNSSAIRFWEKEFTELKPKKNKKGNRLYTQKDIEVIQRIVYLTKDCGYTIEGARARMKTTESEELDVRSEVLNRLKKVRKELTELKNNIKRT
jgi:DNA-binding transcriptional MerR regulator